MATPASTLINRIRRRLRDFPDYDSITASTPAGGATLTVADNTRYFGNERIEIDTELLTITSKTGGATLNVRRGAWGTTAESHASGATILIDPAFPTVDVLDLLNEGMDQMWPWFYREVVDTTSIVPDGTTTEFLVPTVTDLGSIPFPRVHMVEIRYGGFTDFVKVRPWLVQRGTAANSKIKFGVAPPTGATIRVRGYAPYAHFVLPADALDAQFPPHAEALPVIWAVGELLAAGEAGRVRFDKGPVDQREQANRPGSALSASRDRRATFLDMVLRLAPPPMSKNIVVFP